MARKRKSEFTEWTYEGFAADYNSGMSRAELMEKYKIKKQTIDSRISACRRKGLLIERDRQNDKVKMNEDGTVNCESHSITMGLCKYSSETEGCCEYILKVGCRRGCKASHCDKFKPKKGNKNAEGAIC